MVSQTMFTMASVILVLISIIALAQGDTALDIKSYGFYGFEVDKNEYTPQNTFAGQNFGFFI